MARVYLFECDCEPPRTAGSDWVEEIPLTRDQAIARFLHRWSWRGDHASVEIELRELLAHDDQEGR